MSIFSCRFCNAMLTHSLVDLGKTPLANSYLAATDLTMPEPSYPLHARVCGACLLVQVESVVPPDHIFGHYAYFSSYSSSWVEHARRFTETMTERLGLSETSKVVEIASNDGYLLQHFVKRGIPCLGIEPAANVAEAAIKAGVPTEVRFFGKETARDLGKRGWQADLIIANNVLAHVPDLNDFVAGIAALLGPQGVMSVECPHVLELIRHVQFDTIYHEHYCYFSVTTLRKVFAAHGLTLFDVEKLPTHGGSLRLLAQRTDGPARPQGDGLRKALEEESAAQLDTLDGYRDFSEKVQRVCKGLKEFLALQRQVGKTVAAYGAAAKGNTLLNVCGIGVAQIPYVVDKNPHKQAHYLPGSHLPIYSPEKVSANRPDYLLILPWNLAEEISAEMRQVRAWGGKFVTAIPEITVF